MSDLFSPLTVGNLALPNRILMAALTRARAGRTHIPNTLMAEYYAQRASAGQLRTQMREVRVAIHSERVRCIPCKPAARST